MTKFFIGVIIVIGCMSTVKLAPVFLPFDVGNMVSSVINGTKWLDSSVQGQYMIPGTNWCGPGTVAKNYDDLGERRNLDECCRTHDYCPHIILSGETKYNHHNDNEYTLLSCECEQEFKQCLNDCNKLEMTVIEFGYLFVQEKCFILDNYNAVLTNISDFLSNKKK